MSLMSENHIWEARMPKRARTFLKGSAGLEKPTADERAQITAFLGDRGTGKTIEACRMIYRWCEHTTNEKAVAARYTKALQIFMAIREAYQTGSKQTEKQLVEEFLRPHLLVIDEIQQRSESTWENNLLTHIIDRRYDAMRATIIIGNLTPAELGEQLGESITSRMTETGGIRVFQEQYRV